MAVFGTTHYVGTKVKSVDEAAQHLVNHINTLDTGSTLRLVELAEIGPGKYWQAVTIYG